MAALRIRPTTVFAKHPVRRQSPASPALPQPTLLDRDEPGSSWQMQAAEGPQMLVCGKPKARRFLEIALYQWYVGSVSVVGAQTERQAFIPSDWGRVRVPWLQRRRGTVVWPCAPFLAPKVPMESGTTNFLYGAGDEGAYFILLSGYTQSQWSSPQAGGIAAAAWLADTPPTSASPDDIPLYAEGNWNTGGSWDTTMDARSS
ncbi:hypothetical protein AYO20_11652 [Fonsecaea nubica]|uniref:Uncharacterized protein n=1 Tax=Fonsecaea nubica TaxID=856822 RepID=A0A178BPX1_9EURO|nr:hypothetical protein AYO20_11652 [Fonsecaea nubica]OAL19397.1 hypothetical protein AYO20_11652 [Fonsecaea nubica]